MVCSNCNAVVHKGDADGMTDSINPDQTAPLGATVPGSAMFAKTYLFQNQEL